MAWFWAVYILDMTGILQETLQTFYLAIESIVDWTSNPESIEEIEFCLCNPTNVYDGTIYMDTIWGALCIPHTHYIGTFCITKWHPYTSHSIDMWSQCLVLWTVESKSQEIPSWWMWVATICICKCILHVLYSKGQWPSCRVLNLYCLVILRFTWWDICAF